LALAGASTLWAFKPEYSSVRFAQQAMIISSIVLPTLLAAPTADLLRGVFLVFALALIINLFFVLNQNPMILELGRICYAGIYTFKGVLGECGAVALILSLNEILYRGWRRVFALIVIGIAIYLIILSDSKGSLALALPAPFLAGLTLFISKRMRISPALVLLPIPICYAIASEIVGNLVNRISWYLYGNFTLSGRTIIWDFANLEIARRPFLGWGYQSFWLVGPDAPSITDAPGWVKNMPSSHSGYLDTMVDMGYAGIILLVTFLFATLHAIGRVADRDPSRAWILLTLALYLILTNFIETGWMHGIDLLWLLFLIVAAEAARYCRPSPSCVIEPMVKGPLITGGRPRIAPGRGSGKLARLRRGRT
jgi:O-antigen ligase